MRLIIGLGNPGARYAGSLHNIGFTVLDNLAERLNLAPWKAERLCLITAGHADGGKFLLIKPQTWMNNSGEGVGSMVRYYHADTSDVVVVTDDIDLGCGCIRVRESGSSAGHNGLKSIINHLGTDKFRRLKIGVGRPQHGSVADYVLGQPRTADDAILLSIAEQNATDLLAEYVDTNLLKGQTINPSSVNKID